MTELSLEILSEPDLPMPAFCQIQAQPLQTLPTLNHQPVLTFHLYQIPQTPPSPPSPPSPKLENLDKIIEKLEKIESLFSKIVKLSTNTGFPPEFLREIINSLNINSNQITYPSPYNGQH